MIILSKENLIVIIGPTAVGKTALGIKLAQKYNTEIISGDSMQVYRDLNIGTAKVTVEESQGIKHHLIDILDIDQKFSAADFQNQAKKIISEINAKGKIPIIVGGTGLYIESLIDNFNFLEVKEDPLYRQSLWNRLNKFGSKLLHTELLEIDAKAANNIHPNDHKKLIRALEVHHLSQGRNKSSLGKKSQSNYNLLYLGLKKDRNQLYQTINKRVDQMIEGGLLDEAKYLLAANLDPETNSMLAIGYKELFPYLKGELELETCIDILKRNSRRFAKRQMTWFKRDDRIIWLDRDKLSESEIIQMAQELINDKFFL